MCFTQGVEYGALVNRRTMMGGREARLEPYCVCLTSPRNGFPLEFQNSLFQLIYSREQQCKYFRKLISRMLPVRDDHITVCHAFYCRHHQGLLSPIQLGTKKGGPAVRIALCQPYPRLINPSFTEIADRGLACNRFPQLSTSLSHEREEAGRLNDLADLILGAILLMSSSGNVVSPVRNALTRSRIMLTPRIGRM